MSDRLKAVRRLVTDIVIEAIDNAMHDLDDLVHGIDSDISEAEVLEALGGYPDFSDSWEDYTHLEDER